MTTKEPSKKCDYTSAADQIARIERSKGRPATEREKARVVALTKRYVEVSKELAEAKAQADKWYQEALTARTEPKPNPGEKAVRARIKVVPRIFTDEAAAAAMARLKAKGFGVSAGINPPAAKVRLRTRFASVLGGAVCAALGLVRLLARKKNT